MKFKFLSLVLTLGLLALGAEVKAQAEERAPEGTHHHAQEAGTVTGKEGSPQDVVSIIKGLICTAIQTNLVQKQIPIPTCCTGVCSSGTPSLSELGQCSATIYAFAQDTTKCTGHPKTCAAVKKIISATQSACNSWLNPICNTTGCKVPQVQQACGYICCNMAAGSGVKNCMGGADKCTSVPYNQQTCFSNGSLDSEAAKAGW